MQMPTRETVMTEEDKKLTDALSILNHVWLTHQQEMMDDKVTFRYEPGKGHIEFYQYGPFHIAICVYECRVYTVDERDDRLNSYNVVGKRSELLVLEMPTTASRVALCVKEMRNMIKRKRIGPVTRRIKFLDNSDK